MKSNNRFKESMKLAAYILVLAFLASCWSGYEINEIYIQKIENSDKSIFEYTAWSTLNNGVKTGSTILNSNESIGIREAEQMPFDFLVGCPTKDTLFTIELKEGGTTHPKYLSTSFSNFKGFAIKTDFYSYEEGSSMNLSYKFSGFRETRDILIISGVETNPTGKSEIAFCKGNIKLIESDSLDGVLMRIEVEAFLLNHFNKTSIDRLTIINDSYERTGLTYFEFEPTRQINVTEFSNFGIFKKREVIDKKILQ